MLSESDFASEALDFAGHQLDDDGSTDASDQ